MYTYCHALSLLGALPVAAPAGTDLGGGRIDMMCYSSTSAGPFIAAKKLKALAVAASDPSPLLPGVRTIAPSGVPGYRMKWWYGLLAPKSLDDAAVDRVAQAVSAAWNAPDVLSRFAALGVEPLQMTDRHGRVRGK